VARRGISRVGSITTRFVAVILLPIATIGYLGLQTIEREAETRSLRARSPAMPVCARRSHR
jgi:hypothetical protein